ncbi:MAG: gluconokinase [Corynebacterium sp.]|nr:gluconokinase [Corynebacterium sp.]
MIHLVVMGVCGSGKSTLARALRKATGFNFAEGDNFHPPANKKKMASGIPLTDEDRWPWLESLRNWMLNEDIQGRSSIMACSALKHSYRDALIDPNLSAPVLFISLEGDPELFRTRLEERTDHYMKANMLQSQLDTFEPLDASENYLRLNIADSVETNVGRVLDAIQNS